MADRDSAFLWETEVLRNARRPTASTARTGVIADDEQNWMTLREASDATGVPASTIRKWARHDNIPSFLERTSTGQLRIVSMKGIRQWAEVIGRDIDDGAVPDEARPGAEEPQQVDLAVEEALGEKTPVPEGSMLVPLDAWNRMLNQLGNLHEAGQQLAEARERAAKAETEAVFLRERLRELKDERQRAVPEGPADQPQPASSRSLLSRIYAGWRDRKGG